jgi:tRNA(fMet)-specific endonuclease VapC
MLYVLDSNIVIAAMNGVPSVASRLDRVDAEDVAVPAVAIAELLYGAYRSRRREENLARIVALRHQIATLWLTDAIVNRYGSLRAELQSRGIAKSDFDLLIAATALDAGATLVTHDQALLDGTIAALPVQDWLAH